MAGTEGSKLGICGLRLPVQMCMLPLGIFKRLQIKKGGNYALAYERQAL